MSGTWKWNPDGTVDVKGDVCIIDYPYSKLPVKFNKVTGDFTCGDNHLTTLEGCPEFVGGYFNCCRNLLSSVDFAPKKVNDNFYCIGNLLLFTEKDVRKVCKVAGTVITSEDYFKS